MGVPLGASTAAVSVTHSPLSPAPAPWVALPLSTHTPLGGKLERYGGGDAGGGTGGEGGGGEGITPTGRCKASGASMTQGMRQFGTQ